MKRKKFYLELLLKDEIVEGQVEPSVFSRRVRTSLVDVVQVLQRAAKDPKIVALSLTVQALASGWARLSDLRRCLKTFRESGKPTYCFLQNGSNAEYYLASACDRVFMPPAGHLQLIGLSAEAFFFRELLDRFGVEPQFEAVGEYKSAAEMFTRKSMSAFAREQMEILLDDYYEELCGALADRELSRHEVAARINSGPYTAREALSQRLLDGVCYQDEVVETLKRDLGTNVRSLQACKYFKYDGFFKRVFTFLRPRIAIIDVLGFIDSGESRRGRSGRHVTGCDTLAGFLDHANRSRRIRAVVLRVNSPGGSGLASDLIWRKISLVGKNKPIVASFGDVAASGGYYIAAPATLIIAEPTSITGSIGVLGGKFVARELMSRLAVYRESILRGEHAEYESPFSGFSQSESEKLNRQLQEFYAEEFIKKVADGRKIGEKAVDEVGRGRVWSGKRAKEHNLVDRVGGFTEAVEEARRLAKIPDSKKVRLVRYRRRRKLWEKLLPDFQPSMGADTALDTARETLDLADDIGKSSVLLLMPYQIKIR